MVKIVAIDPEALDRRRGRRPSAEAQAQMDEFRRLVSGLRTRDDVYLVNLEPGDKPATIRQRLLRAAADVGVEIAVRKHVGGWAIGLLTPERRRRPRRPRTERQAAQQRQPVIVIHENPS